MKNNIRCFYDSQPITHMYRLSYVKETLDQRKRGTTFHLKKKLKTDSNLYNILLYMKMVFSLSIYHTVFYKQSNLTVSLDLLFELRKIMFKFQIKINTTRILTIN